MQAFGSKPGSCQSDPNNRSIVIQITDSCPECAVDQIDIQALTWAKIANPSPSGGRINMQYRVSSSCRFLPSLICLTDPFSLQKFAATGLSNLTTCSISKLHDHMQIPISYGLIPPVQGTWVPQFLSLAHFMCGEVADLRHDKYCWNSSALFPASETSDEMYMRIGA